MNGLVEQFGNMKIDIVICDDEQWFKGKDIAKILGYDNATKALRDNIDIQNKLSLQLRLKPKIHNSISEFCIKWPFYIDYLFFS